MKFEFDNKTGGMRPKKDEGIYFSNSLSGGLRVQDKKNNKRYIIEKDETVKFLAGENKNLNIYDQRNANIIAERVKRMFGRDHKYANPKLFLRGYHIVESFQDFHRIDELWRGGVDRAKSGEIRKEQGIKIVLPDDQIVILGDRGCGLPQRFREGDYYVEVEIGGVVVFLFAYEDDGDYTYFIYNDVEDEDGDNLYKVATCDYDMELDDFVLIVSMLESEFVDERDLRDGDYMEFTKNATHRYNCVCGRRDYLIFDNLTDAEDYAFDYMYDLLDEMEFDNGSIERWISYFGHSFIDTAALDEWMEEDYKNYVDEIENEDGDMGNRLFDELKEHDLIEDTEDYFEPIEREDVDDNTERDDDVDDEYEDMPELDYDSPKFDIEDMKEKLVEALCGGYEDSVEWYMDNFGADELGRFIDKDILARKIVDEDGILNSIGYSDEYEYHTEDYEIYIYKQ